MTHPDSEGWTATTRPSRPSWRRAFGASPSFLGPHNGEEAVLVAVYEKRPGRVPDELDRILGHVILDSQRIDHVLELVARLGEALDEFLARLA